MLYISFMYFIVLYIYFACLMHVIYSLHVLLCYFVFFHLFNSFYYIHFTCFNVLFIYFDVFYVGLLHLYVAWISILILNNTCVCCVNYHFDFLWYMCMLCELAFFFNAYMCMLREWALLLYIIHVYVAWMSIVIVYNTYVRCMN